MPGIIVSSGAAMVAIQAQRRAVEHCRNYEAIFDPSKATVEAKQYYASCISLLYPNSDAWFAPWELLGLKIAFIVVVLSTIVGAFVGESLADTKIGSALMGALWWFSTSSLLVVIVYFGVEAFVHLF